MPALKYVLIPCDVGLEYQLTTCGWRVRRADPSHEDGSGQLCWTEEMEGEEVDRVLEEFRR